MPGREKHWPVPYLQKFHEPMTHGRAIGIKMELKWTLGQPKFFVNLGTGPNIKAGHHHHEDDIGLQVDFRGNNDGYVVNAKIHKHWGKEERFRGAHLKKDEEVYVRIEIGDRHYTIFINGEKLGHLEYRVPLRDINHVYVDGDIHLNRVAFEGRYYMVPFDFQLSSFGPGRQVYISGKPEPNAEKFDIDLMSSHHGDIPLCISARFRDGHVVRNTKEHDKWQKEETHGPFPFYQGEDFDMIIDTHPNHYDIIINGKKMFNFQHRMSPTQVSHLNVHGQIELSSIYV